MRKDFDLILQAAAQFGFSMPATEAAAKVNLAEAASGHEEDFSAVIHWMEEQARVEKIAPAMAEEEKHYDVPSPVY